MNKLIEARVSGVNMLPRMNEISRNSLNAILRQDIAVERKLKRSHEPYEYTAVLPPIIGYVPMEERRNFTSFCQTYKNGFAELFNLTEEDRSLLNGINSSIPKTYEQIKQDIRSVGDPGLRLSDFEIEHTITRPGLASRDGGFHVDPLAYLVSDKGTDYYSGKAKLLYNEEDAYYEIANDLFEGKYMIAQAPPFAIVRKGPWTIHKSHIYQDESERTFFRVGTVTF